LIPLSALQLRVGSLVIVRAPSHLHQYGRVVVVPPKDGSGGKEKCNGVSNGMLTVRLNVSEEQIQIPSTAITILDANALPRDHPAFDTRESLARKEQQAKELDDQKMKLAREEQQRRDNQSNSSSESDGEDGDSDKPNKKTKQAKRRRREDSGGSSSSTSKRSGSGSRKRHRSQSSSPPKSTQQGGSSDKQDDIITWVVPGIRVRVTSRQLSGGKYFVRTGCVEDVLSRTLFSLVMDADSGASNNVKAIPARARGDLLDRVRQSMVETALPRTGGRVMVLRGAHKQQIGELIDRDKSTQRATVQLQDTMQTCTVMFDDIAEYVRETA